MVDFLPVTWTEKRNQTRWPESIAFVLPPTTPSWRYRIWCNPDTLRNAKADWAAVPFNL